MKNYSKITAVILTSLMLATALFGCGNSSDTVSSDTTSGGTTSEVSSGTQQAQKKEPKEPVEIVYTCWGSATEKKATEATIAKFEQENSWIKVKTMVIPNANYDTKITTMVAANEPLDISQLESATIAYPLAEQGKLMNLKTIAENSETPLSDFVPEDLFYLDKDTIIGVGNGLEVFNLFYNKDMIQAAGVETPPTDPEKAWTWDQFVETAKKLTVDKNGKNALDPSFDPKKIVQYGISFPKWWGLWGNFIYSNGGDYVTQDGKFGLSQPEAVEALQKLADLINVHHVAPTPTAEKGLPGTEIALQTKKVAMAIDGQWVHLPIDSAKFNFGSGVLPKMKELKTQAVTGMLSIYANTKNPEASWKLATYLVDPGQDITLYKNGNLMPVTKPWLTEKDKLDQWTTNTTARPDGYVQGIVGMLLNYSVPTPTGTVKNFNKIIDIVNPALDKVWLGQQTAQEAMKAAETKAQPLVQGKRER